MDWVIFMSALQVVVLLSQYSQVEITKQTVRHVGRHLKLCQATPEIKVYAGGLMDFGACCTFWNI